MLVDDVKDSYYNSVVQILCLTTKDEDVVHVYDHNSLFYKFSEDVVHHHLEHCWAVSETKEHD